MRNNNDVKISSENERKCILFEFSGNFKIELQPIYKVVFH